ncbi:MAG: def [Planctomycetaceae bacterium]|nr:def [Planctomycetaceae bacterium]
MEIVYYPHPALRWKSQPIRQINDEVRQVVREMFALMYEHKGIGLAANQVALPWQLFVLNLTGNPEEKDEEHVFINPEIIKRKGSEEGEEGCLSLPKLYGDVRRAAEIIVEAYDLDGQGFSMTLDELGARCVQHEFDHLQGTLFVDRMSETKRHEVESLLNDFALLFRRQQESGQVPGDAEIEAQLKKLEPK